MKKREESNCHVPRISVKPKVEKCITKSRTLDFFSLLVSSQYFRYDNTVTSLTIHTPDLHLTVICPRYNEWHSRVKCSPVNSTIMTLYQKKVVCKTKKSDSSYPLLKAMDQWTMLMVIKDVSDFHSM